ncbi:EfeM/EfeO family lipoprotein [Tsukamurella sp. 8F]|uniref:EfeM/EfeO family lipoprotein n=1 Tax=unclassified Tsukamurella TaxID=2633480 RepID=UPI0023B8FABC|nr:MULTISPECIES: EfeM/EfeO family lipoprotein [unclassified Tsukamurella]MDF0532488.1 EfeM/EfeO family lipoprotein [Tsukamurella sp. 8J]MDF0589159.1 EfeM/EfeO family lipoprotein [Tsukamurella sp. 8F]
MPVPARWVAPTAFTAAAVVAAAGILTYSLTGDSRTAPTPTVGNLSSTAVDATLDGCAHPGGDLAGGSRVFAVTNRTTRALEISVAGADGTVYAELEGVGPASTRLMQVSLPAGTFHFECYFAETPELSGAGFAVTRGAAAPGAGVAPVSTQDLTPVTLAYQSWISARLPQLQADARALAAAPDIASQRTAWLTAHHLYETLGAAYDAFGDWDAKINGDDSGFHAVEESLWDANPTVPTDLEKQLVADVDGLTADFPNIAVDPLQIGLRAHEITENTIEFTLSGRDDHGSHASTDTALANLAGTRELLDRLTPLLKPRYARLDDTGAALDKAVAVTTEMAAKYPGKPLSEYAQADRERLNASFGGLVELLAPIAAITDVRRTK